MRSATAGVMIGDNGPSSFQFEIAGFILQFEPLADPYAAGRKGGCAIAPLAAALQEKVQTDAIA